MTTTQRQPMSYVRLGRSGLKVSKIILGCMSYGSDKWQDWIIGDEDEVVKHIKTAYEAGINTFDTADGYSNGESEVMLGKAIKKLNLPRDEIVILTKVWLTVGKTPGERLMGGLSGDPDTIGYVNQHGLSRKHIFEAVKHSLERLQLDYIDVLQCHRFDYNTPIEETMQALHDVVQAGYVRYLGLSACWAYQFHAMQNYAITNRLTPFISMQNHYNLLYREEEREMFPTLKMFGVGAIPFSPFARGILTRPFDQDKATFRSKTDPFQVIYANHGKEKIVAAVEKIAKDKGVSMAQISLAWVMAKEGVTAPVVGTTSLENLHDILGAVNITLSPEEMKELEEGYVAQGTVGHA